MEVLNYLSLSFSHSERILHPGYSILWCVCVCVHILCAPVGVCNYWKKQKLQPSADETLYIYMCKRENLFIYLFSSYYFFSWI